MRIVLAASVAFLTFPAQTARADSTCDVVTRAMLAVADQPVRQRMLQGPPGRETVLMESLALKDAMFLRDTDSGRWTRMPIGRAEMRRTAEAALAHLPLSACSGPRGGDDAGTPVLVYDYTQPNPLKPSEPSRSTIWIGKADGRLRRIVLSDGSYQTIEYGDFAAPAP